MNEKLIGKKFNVMLSLSKDGNVDLDDSLIKTEEKELYEELLQAFYNQMAKIVLRKQFPEKYGEKFKD